MPALAQVKYSPTYIPDTSINFCFPIPEVLESERVRLVPFNPSQHAEPFFAATKDTNTYTYLPFGPFATRSELVQTLWEGRVCPLRTETLFAVYDKTRVSESGGPAFAGLIGYINASATDLCIEIGCVVVLPAFQRTHVASNAAGILLHYALDLPSESSADSSAGAGCTGGLGLRRCVWMANNLNRASVGAAERMGFVREGVMRWHRVLKPGQSQAWNQRDIRKGDPREECGGRDTVILSLCFDDWENGGREKADAVMDRRI